MTSPAHGAQPSSSPCLLRVRGLSKSFPGVQALAGVDLELRAGQVHALAGENGAGKSTLLRLLAGLEQPDAGVLIFQDRPVRFRQPHDARRCGIAMIHQELLLCPELTVAENIFLGQEPVRGLGVCVARRALEAEAARLLTRLRVSLAPSCPVRQLSVAERQSVEIAKALAQHAQLLIMDEPTSALSAPEVAALFEVIADLRRQGVAVLYVSHKLEELRRVAEVVTVLRDGRHVATAPLASLDDRRLIALMVGRDVEQTPAPEAAAAGDVLLAARDLTRAGAFQGLSFFLRRGEVLGLTGLMGAGRTELLHALYGLAPADTGELRVRGRRVEIATPAAALRQGLALVSEDRQLYGLIPTMSVQHNLTLACLPRCCRGPLIDPQAESRLAEEQGRALGIKTRDPTERITRLSGGNQQKVVFARALLTEPDVLLLDEPTRGIDVAAKAEIHSLIRRLARAGKAILLVSSELPEVLALSDRLLVMRQGAFAAELDPRRTTPEEVMRHAMLN